jgi:insertion element IS1 protein InsB
MNKNLTKGCEIMKIRCPKCESIENKKNGHIHNGKQNHYCKKCGRQFVENPKQKLISTEKKEQIRKLLLERISLLGICRVMGVSLRWLLGFIVSEYKQLPDNLNYHSSLETDKLLIWSLESEVDEMWSFVGRKENKQWVWIAMDAKSRQIIAFYVGDRSQDSAKKLWELIPEYYREKATFYTDAWQAYKAIIPEERHHVIDGKTNHIERFNCTMRQRISRLVRQALSFSKKLSNHIGAIKYFICNYNLDKALRV